VRPFLLGHVAKRKAILKQDVGGESKWLHVVNNKVRQPEGIHK